MWVILWLVLCVIFGLIANVLIKTKKEPLYVVAGILIVLGFPLSVLFIKEK